MGSVELSLTPLNIFWSLCCNYFEFLRFHNFKRYGANAQKSSFQVARKVVGGSSVMIPFHLFPHHHYLLKIG